jgi:hypothetical protein
MAKGLINCRIRIRSLLRGWAVSTSTDSLFYFSHRNTTYTLSQISLLITPKHIKMSATDVYIHSSTVEEGEIRLFLLQPSQDLNDDVHGCLVHMILKACENDIINHYDALSYVWGDQNDTSTIVVDGKSLSVTARVRCNFGRTAFVSISPILRIETSKLLRWALSTPPPNTPSSSWAMGFPKCDSVFALMASQNEDPFSSRLANHAVLWRETFENLVKEFILSRPWYGRVWVLQELVLSVKPWVQCEHRVKWESFVRFVLPISRTRGSLDEPTHPLMGMNNTRRGYYRKMYEDSEEGKKSPGISIGILYSLNICNRINPQAS